jgi:PAS domain S-box-containing protein
MFFGGFSGGIAFHPDKVVDSPYVPPVVLTDFRLFGRPVMVGGGSPLSKSIGYTTALTLSHDQNIFSLEFSALSYFNSATNRYRYKLDGLDHQWHEVGSKQRVLTYTTLPPGTYTLHVQGATSRGAWTEPGLELYIQIRPAWWNAWWFRGVCVLVSVALLGGLYRLRIQQVQRQEKHLRDVVETIPAMTFTALSDGSSTFVNKRWTEYTGLCAEETSGAGWQRALHPADLARHSGKWHISIATGQLFEDEARFRRAADGEYRWFLVRGVPLRDRHRNIVKWYGTLTDIEDRKRAEQERERLRQLEADLAHVNRLSLLGELASSVSHELKQPIAAAMTNANTCIRWLERDRPDVDEALEAATRIVKDGNRATEIIDRLRSLYKKSPPRRELVDVGEIVREMLVLLQGETNRYSILTRTELAPDLARITADRVQLQQVFMNLMLNAIEAMKDTGGELMIKAEPVQGGQLLISVSDTGVGLPSERTDEIFNAFFTTKSEGSGMGLAISRSIIESHGGRLWACANTGQGATFHFTLPSAPSTSSTTAA